jgi:hypothetical protein
MQHARPVHVFTEQGMMPRSGSSSAPSFDAISLIDHASPGSTITITGQVQLLSVGHLPMRPRCVDYLGHCFDDEHALTRVVLAIGA